jgi:hypothetical protein
MVEASRPSAADTPYRAGRADVGGGVCSAAGGGRPEGEVIMRAVKEWKVDLMLGENDGRSYAEASLVTEIGDRVVGTGYAWLAPTDYDVPEIGDEIAVGRALRDLGRRLLDTASGDIQGMTGERVRLSR